ncbi:MAG TPA: hypothetical protein VHK69_00230, partial [Chitinophagaceae bacterium]|nr:hypothetical protein [Chitinophagaceae bacterium]
MKNLYLIFFTLLTALCPARAQVPLHNSFPAAEATVFIDFDGHTVSGTAWNGGGTVACAPSGLNTIQMTEVFHRVAEDFRPFNINITTDSAKYWSAPAFKRMRVVVTVTSEWYGRAGGVAWTGSFTWGDNTPCFVFSQLLGLRAKSVAEAVSHEAGHTLGLRHQSVYDATCRKIADYHGGTGEGETGWAPIMGNSYSKNFTGWHRGPNSSGCNVIQSDLDVITNTINGFGYRSDDYGAEFSTAAAARVQSNQLSVSGMISTPSDKDLFKFVVTGTRRVAISAIPTNLGDGSTGSNLDIEMELFDGQTNSIGVYNPSAMLSASVDTTLNTGTYYLSIDGKGNRFTSEYGSLGSFSVEGQFGSMNALPLRRLELKGSTGTDGHELSWEIDADETVTRQVVEVSANGSPFTAAGAPAVAARSLVLQPAAAGVVLYRMRVLFDNGREHYSNVIALRSDGERRPSLVASLVSGEQLQVTSPGDYDYTVLDLGGRTLTRGRV